ncbi:N-acetyl-gamma-glutamyl-phosphate reductase [Bacteroidia bacterium]|nr:N-acetyl-gamma-glutamyl-phosphate reductase [Bacteroidia bacterium]
MMITIGIVGGAGYTAGELLRILIGHGSSKVEFVHSTTQAGQPVSAVHTDLTGDTDLIFTDALTKVDVLFLCLGHGLSADFLKQNSISDRTHIIDLGNDFRVNAQCGERHFVYGLPEINKEKICTAHNIANPGCFATAIQLALLPLAQQKLLRGEVHIHGITGSTGAGRGLSETSHFSYRNNNLSVYKPFTHQHLAEVNNTLSQINGSNGFELNFIPVRGNFTRGIFATLYTPTHLSEDELLHWFTTFYKDQPFVHICQPGQNVSLKDVINTNKCLLQVQKINGKALITSVIDNLVKGASGQAVQNMNLMFGMPETAGLQLKSIGF